MLSIATITSRNTIATMQDSGRMHGRHWGIGTGGAMDKFSYILANQLAANNEDMAVLEIGNIPFSIAFDQDAFIGIAATNVYFIIDKTLFYGCRSMVIHAGQELTIPYQPDAQWKYIAIHGGWQTQKVMGSRSTNVSLGMDALKKGFRLPYNSITSWPSEKSIDINRRQTIIKIIAGPETHCYNADVLKNCFDRSFTISPQSNRMAYSFTESIDMRSDLSIQSSAVCPGMIQLTPSGFFYILMKDCQTTGGYPRIGWLDDEQLNALTRISFNEKVKFEFVE